MTAPQIFQIVAPHFIGDIVFVENVSVGGSPDLRYLAGIKLAQIKELCGTLGWILVRIDEPKIGQPIAQPIAWALAA